jgi:ATP-dependent Clp protease ATP-binding subunit ClpA
MSDESLCNFTPRAQQVVALARKEADRFNHNCVGTEHLLLGLIKLGHGVAVNVLRKMGLDLDTVRQEVEKLAGAGSDQKMMGPIPITPRVKKVLALAQKEARNLNHTYVGTEHLLLGLLREGEGVAARILKDHGADIEQMRLEVLKELDPNVASDQTPSCASRPVARPLLRTPGTNRILSLAQMEAQALGHPQIGPEHLLLGLLRDGDNLAVRALQNLGLDLERTRQELQRLASAGGTDGNPSAGPAT